MGEFYYTRNDFDCMGLTIPSGWNTDGIIFAATDVAMPGQNIQQNCVLSLSNGLSASILAVPQNNLTYKGEKIAALLLTSGHCIGNIFTGKFKFAHLTGILTPNRFRTNTVYPEVYLKHFLEDAHIDSLSDSTGYRYCVPSDLALCLLLGDTDKSTLREVIIDQSPRNPGDSILVSGHPYSKKSSYVIHAGEDEDTDKLTKKLIEAFHNFNCLVNSIGGKSC